MSPNLKMKGGGGMLLTLHVYRFITLYPTPSQGVGWPGQRGVLLYNTVIHSPGGGEVRGNILTQPSPPPPHFIIFASKDMLLNYISIRRYKNVNKEEE